MNYQLKKQHNSFYKWLEMRCHPDLHKEVIDIINSYNLNKNIKILVLASWSWAFDLRLFDNWYINITSVELDKEWYLNDKNNLIDFKQIDLNKNFYEEFNELYDLIICIEIIEHLYNINNFLNNTYKLLTDSSSILLITTPNIHDIFSKANFIISWYPSFFMTKPYLYWHVYPILLNIIEHFSDLNKFKIDKIITKNNYLKHMFSYYKINITLLIYYFLLITLIPFIYVTSIINRKMLYWANLIITLKK